MKLSEKYDQLYKASMEVLGKYNICQFDADGLCARSRARVAEGERTHNRYNCCGPISGADTDDRCEYLGDKGCTVECLHCRVWFCDYVWENNMVPDEAVPIIKDLVNEMYYAGFYAARTPKQQMLRQIHNNRKYFRKIMGVNTSNKEDANLPKLS